MVQLEWHSAVFLALSHRIGQNVQPDIHRNGETLFATIRPTVRVLSLLRRTDRSIDYVDQVLHAQNGAAIEADLQSVLRPRCYRPVGGHRALPQTEASSRVSTAYLAHHIGHFDLLRNNRPDFGGCQISHRFASFTKHFNCFLS